MKTILAALLLLSSLSVFADEISAEVETEEVFSSFISEVKHNKELRKLFRQSRKSKNQAVRVELEGRIHEFFESRGVELGYFDSGFYNSYTMGMAGASYGANSDFRDSSTLRMGPGFGMSAGYQMTACTYRRTASTKKQNHGATIVAVIGVGITSGMTVGKNGVCVHMGVGVGLELQAAYEQLYIND